MFKTALCWTGNSRMVCFWRETGQSLSSADLAVEWHRELFCQHRVFTEVIIIAALPSRCFAAVCFHYACTSLLARAVQSRGCPLPNLSIIGYTQRNA